jgi:hypothetical protein
MELSRLELERERIRASDTGNSSGQSFSRANIKLTTYHDGDDVAVYLRNFEMPMVGHRHWLYPRW